MKNIFKSTLLLLCSVLFLASCNDDNSHNPTLETPSTFKLNVPTFSTQLIDLATSTGIDFSWSQPAYGFPVAAEYQMQFSLDNKWTTSTDQAIADETGATVADYTIIEDVFTVTKGQVSAAKLAKGLEQIAKWTEDAVPTTQKVYARCASTVAGTSIYSNVVELTLVPYYVELKDAAPVIWYMIGSDIGDGKWTNSADATGTSNFPMFPIAGETYDKKTGTGKIQYAGYFHAANGFKIIEQLGSWDYGICGGGEPGKTSYRSKGDDPGDIKVAEDGYYTIVLDTKTHECTITKMETVPTVFTSMAIPGSENKWDVVAGDLMTASSASATNHDWVATVTYKADAGSKDGSKFAANGGWDYNWGASDFPYGTGTAGGGNIRFKAGKYKVFFNDILGSYSFVAQ